MQLQFSSKAREQMLLYLEDKNAEIYIKPNPVPGILSEQNYMNTMESSDIPKAKG